MSMHEASAGNFGLLSNQGISGSFSLEAENTGSLSHTYSCGKTPLEVLVESWLTSSFEDRESVLISRQYGEPGFFILLLFGNGCSYRLEMGVSGNLWLL